jgi:hypothetical protein
VQNVTAPWWKVTNPVAPDGRPLSDKVTAVPYETDVGVASALKGAGARTTVKLVVALDAAKLPSPE